MEANIKGDIYERLLEKNAEDTKSGAGQYFYAQNIDSGNGRVFYLNPITIVNPVCGKGWIFIAAYDFLINPESYVLDKAQKQFLKHNIFYGNEIVANTRHLCFWNSLVSPSDVPYQGGLCTC